MSDPFFPVLLILRYLHIFGAITLFGGSLFAYFAVVPTLATLSDNERKSLHEKIRNRWKIFARLAMLALFVSGVANLGLAARYDFLDFKMIYNLLGGVKLLLALPIFFIVELLAGKSAMADKARANLATCLSINLVLATVIVLIGGFMRHIDRKLKPPEETTAVSEHVVPFPAVQSAIGLKLRKLIQVKFAWNIDWEGVNIERIGEPVQADSDLRFTTICVENPETALFAGGI